MAKSSCPRVLLSWRLEPAPPHRASRLQPNNAHVHCRLLGCLAVSRAHRRRGIQEWPRWTAHGDRSAGGVAVQASRGCLVTCVGRELTARTNPPGTQTGGCAPGRVPRTGQRVHSHVTQKAGGRGFYNMRGGGRSESQGRTIMIPNPPPPTLPPGYERAHPSCANYLPCKRGPSRSLLQCLPPQQGPSPAAGYPPPRMQ